MVIFTIGYEGASLAEFLSQLADAGVGLVVDVRGIPLSRKPGFSKTALSASLERSGIFYRHIRELGCPKSIRHRYREDGNWDAYTDAYMAYLGEQRHGLAELGVICSEAPTALLCYEADPNRCHRTYVARAVARMTGGTVGHIGSTGVSQEPATAAGA